MRDIVTPVTQEEVKAVIRRCLEQAALVNYQRLSEYAKLEGTSPAAPASSRSLWKLLLELPGWWSCDFSAGEDVCVAAHGEF